MTQNSTQPALEAPVPHLRRRTWLRWCLVQAGWSVLYFTLYALSIGPMYWYWWEAVYAGGSEWIVIFYGPLAVLAEFIPPFRDFINAWVNWWIL